MHKNFLAIRDFSAEELDYILKRGLYLKRRFESGEIYRPFKGRVLAMIFEKASTRTRVSFEAGFDQLGGTCIYLNSADMQLRNAESMQDTAKVISRMVDIVMVRTAMHERLEEFASCSLVPVINGLTNESHPCQIMGDIMTYMEKRGPITGKTVAWIGAANNVLYSWLSAASILGFKVNISAPIGFKLNTSQLPKDRSCLEFFLDPLEAAAGADIVTTDTWKSTGYDEDNEKRLGNFARWQVTPEVMNAAKKDAMFMHCLPAFRGQEVSAEVIDGPQSVVWDEAENRMHIQKAIMEYLLLGKLDE